MKTLLLVTVMTLVQSTASASENFSSYDDILRELSLSEKTSMDDLRVKEDPVRIHGSVGFVTGRTNLDVPAGLAKSQSMQGVEAIMGIDLFSKQWLAEGALRSFESQRYANTELSMKEFDLRVVHQSPLSRTLDVRWGGGIAARYLNFSNQLVAYNLQNEYSTPATIVLVGLKANINKTVGISADTSLRSRMVSDTIDKGAFDAAIRLTGSF